MVRYPIDGTDQNNQPVKILPKVERQIWFGSECDTNEDKIGIWFWTKIMNTAIKVKKTYYKKSKNILARTYWRSKW